MICCKESQSEERLREQVDSMQLMVASVSDTETDLNEWTEQIAALQLEVRFTRLAHSFGWVAQW